MDTNTTIQKRNTLRPHLLAASRCGAGSQAFSRLSSDSKFAVAQLVAWALGAVAFPTYDKRPALPWRELLDYRPNAFGHFDFATGFGLAPLPGSTLICLDFDCPYTLKDFLLQVPELQASFRVHRGDHRHIWCHLASSPSKAILSLRDEQNQELVSLRGAGAYTIGPFSDHPSGDLYLPDPDHPELARLDEKATQRLLAFFHQTTRPLEAPDQDPPRLVLGPFQASSESVQQIHDEFLQRGARHRPSHDWLPVRCPFHHDRNISAGLRRDNGVLHCFACQRSYSPAEVSQHLGLAHSTVTTNERPQLAGHLQRPGDLPVELNFACELRRQHKLAALVLYLLLVHHSSQNHGKHIHTRKEIRHVGQQAGLTNRRIDYALDQLQRLGFLHRVRHGTYRRIGVQRARVQLGIEHNHYATTSLPSATVADGVRELTAQLTLATQYFLPKDGALSSQQIACCAGTSRSTLYRHEQKLGIERQQRLRPARYMEQAHVFLSSSPDTPWRSIHTHGRTPQDVLADYCTLPATYIPYIQLPSVRCLPPVPTPPRTVLPHVQPVHTYTPQQHVLVEPVPRVPTRRVIFGPPTNIKHPIIV